MGNVIVTDAHREEGHSESSWIRDCWLYGYHVVGGTKPLSNFKLEHRFLYRGGLTGKFVTRYI